MAAEVGGDGGGHKKAKKGRGKKANPRIDMTPMVDLGFLLLTFFVLTTTMGTPKAMPIVVPEKVKDVSEDTKPPEVAQSKVLTLILGADDKVYWYHQRQEEQGEAPELHQTNYSANGVRKVIQERRTIIDTRWKSASDPDPSIVLIKPTEESTYGNLVDILDEMNILQQKKYMLVEVTKDELGMLEDYKKNAGGAPAPAGQ